MKERDRVPMQPGKQPQARALLYNVTWGYEKTAWTMAVVGEEPVEGSPCYVSQTSFDRSPVRLGPNGSELVLLGRQTWITKTTLEVKKERTQIQAMGSSLQMTMTVTSRCSGDERCGPLSVGKSWRCEETAALDPPSRPDSTAVYDVRVATLETITVPAGTFDCYKLEYSNVVEQADEAGARTPIRVEWWSADADLHGPIRVEDHTYDGVEVRELVSITVEGRSSKIQERTAEALASSVGGPLEDAWQRFVNTVGQASRMLFRTFDGEELDRVEGYRHLTRLITLAIRRYLYNRDPDFPVFTALGPDTKFGGENPDFLYLSAPIRADATYRVSGTGGSVNHIQFTVVSGFPGMGPTRTIARLDWRNVRLNDDGTFEIILSAHPRPGNWMRLEPGAQNFTVRQVFCNWDREEAAQLQIVQEGKEGQVQPDPSPECIATGLDMAARLIASNAPLWREIYIPGIRARVPDNVFPVPNPPQDELLASDSCFSIGYYNLQPDEALVVTIQPFEAEYMGIQLTNYWFESLDYANRQTSLNMQQTFVNSDGVIRYVIAHRDPGIPNWLDIGGHSQGLVILRWQGVVGSLQRPQSQVVRFEAICSQFPADTPFVDLNKRREAVARRQATIARRYFP